VRALTVEQCQGVGADVATGRVLDLQVDHGRCHAEWAAKQAWSRRDRAAGDFAIERRDDRRLLEGIDEIKQIAEVEAVLAPKSCVAAVRSGRRLRGWARIEAGGARCEGPRFGHERLGIDGHEGSFPLTP
jgi:hypothetical protein